jgi:uncharacterized protein YuzE
MDIQRTSVAEFKTGHGVIGTTAAAAGPAFPCVKGVKIKADLTNSDNVYVGHDDKVTTSSGFMLDAGEEVFIEVDSLGKVFVIGGAAAQGYSYVAI